MIDATLKLLADLLSSVETLGSCQQFWEDFAEAGGKGHTI